MNVEVALYGSARIVVGQARVDIACETPTTTIGQVVDTLITTYPRAQPYVLDEAGGLPFNIRVLINEKRPNPDATLATILHDGDRLALIVAVAGGGTTLISKCVVADPQPAYPIRAIRQYRSARRPFLADQPEQCR